MRKGKKRRFSKDLSVGFVAGISFTLIFFMVMALFYALFNIRVKDKELNLEPETEITIESSATTKETLIKTSVAVEYSNQEISIYSADSCYVYFDVNVNENNSISSSKYGPIELIGGKKTTVTLSDLSLHGYSKDAQITDVYGIYPFVYGDSELEDCSYNSSNANIELQCYKDKIVLSSNEDCIASFYAQTKNGEKNGFIQSNLELNANEPKTVVLNDLAPGFYSGTTEIVSYSPLTLHGYYKK